MEFSATLAPKLLRERLVSLSQLDAFFHWPDDDLAHLLKPALKAQDPGKLPPPVIAFLREKKVIVERGTDSHFPLRETEPGIFANSVRAAEAAKALPPGKPLTVIDSLCRQEIDSLPREGSLLYLGDRQGGFYAPETATPAIPCSRCLLIRYVSNRQGSSALYDLLQGGQRQAFPLSEEFDFDSLLRVNSESTILPLPTCRECLDSFQEWPSEISPGPFSALSSLQVSNRKTSVTLPQMLWLAGVPTVGFGSSWDRDLDSGRVRAVHEALERYSAHFVPPRFGAEGVLYTSKNSTKLFSRRQTYLTDPGAVSNGLACRRTLAEAVEDGLKEVCERDALARFWLRACREEPSAAFLGSESTKEATLEYFQLDSYLYPTVLAVGQTSEGSRFLGSSCSPLEQAREKARREALQIKSFLSQSRLEVTDDPKSFAQHGMLYWKKPELFPQIENGKVDVRPLEQNVYHCDLTSSDLRRCGYIIVRVIVSGLLSIPQAHQDWLDVLEEAHSQEAPPTLPHPFS